MNFIIIIGAVIIFGIFLLVFIARAGKKRGLSKKDLKFIAEQWNKVSEMAEREIKHALIEADKLLDHVMGKKGFKGSVADKLKEAQHMMNDPESVWHAHKLRNKIAHEIDFDVQKEHGQRAIKHFKKALKDLGAKL